MLTFPHVWLKSFPHEIKKNRFMSFIYLTYVSNWIYLWLFFNMSLWHHSLTDLLVPSSVHVLWYLKTVIPSLIKVQFSRNYKCISYFSECFSLYFNIFVFLSGCESIMTGRVTYSDHTGQGQQYCLDTIVSLCWAEMDYRCKFSFIYLFFNIQNVNR